MYADLGALVGQKSRIDHGYKSQIIRAMYGVFVA